jgi:hypothetical protein
MGFTGTLKGTDIGVAVDVDAEFVFTLAVSGGQFVVQDTTLSVYDLNVFGTNFLGMAASGLYDAVNGMSGGSITQVLQNALSGVATQYLLPQVQGQLNNVVNAINNLPASQAVRTPDLSLTFDVATGRIALVCDF